MQRQSHQIQFNVDWLVLKDRLVYLPGALILGYGFWLTLTA